MDDDLEERQRRNEESQAMLSGLNGIEDTPKDQAELLEQLADDDLVASDETLQNLTTKDIPTANFSEEEAHEFRHYIDVVLERKQAAYPHEGQDVTGILREWAHDDPEAGLDPVSKQDRLTDETFKQGIAARTTKGKEGSLITLALRSITESVVRRRGDNNSGGGILGRLRK